MATKLFGMRKLAKPIEVHLSGQVALCLLGMAVNFPTTEKTCKDSGNTAREIQVQDCEISFMVRTLQLFLKPSKSCETGIKKIVLVPAFLAAGVHTTQRFPNLLV